MLLERERLLPELFGGIVLPPEVHRELSAPGAPASVRSWAADLPEWAQVRAPRGSIPGLRLDPGETEAIALATEISGWLLSDDKRAIQVARQLGVASFGTLGVLQRAHAIGLIEIGPALDALARTNYRHTPGLFERVAQEAERMRRSAL